MQIDGEQERIHRVLKCALCKKELFKLEELFCSTECLDKWRETIKESEYSYGD